MRNLLVFLAFCSSTWGASLAARAETRALSLDEALRVARLQSPVLKRAAAQSKVFDARSDGSLGRLLPQLTGTGSWQHTTDNFVPRPGFAGMPPANEPKWDFVNAYSFVLTGTQLLYDFSSIDLHRADREAALAQVDLERAALLTTEFAVRNAFFVACTQRALVAVADQTLANQEKHLAQIQAFVEVGTRPEIDLAQARTDVANARVELLRAQHGFATAKENLKLVMGVAEAHDYDVIDSVMPELSEELLSSAELVQRANQWRPELAALSRQLHAQSLRTRAAKGRLAPSISLNGNLSKVGIENRPLTTNLFVGASASWNLLQSGTALASIREQGANKSASRPTSPS
jgi:outer membrane protein